MSRKTWVEVVCDDCGCAEHFPAPTTNQWLESEAGYAVLGNLHYCRTCCEDNKLPEVQITVPLG